MAATEASERRDALVERLFGATIGAMDVASVYVGVRLGLYRALADRGRSSSADLAEAAGLNERYVREWLEQQVRDLRDREDEHEVVEELEHRGALLPADLASALEAAHHVTTYDSVSIC
ncbi:MAG TPA: hypothetical protein VE615_04240, partial [Gaiellaceae bacterium]|nr:hypothetical protein [Gaiellaceae bacterium]